MSDARPNAPAISLASINVERSKHLGRVVPFLRAHNPDVVCLQELIYDDIPQLCRELGYPHHNYVRMGRHPGEGRARLYGVGILSRSPLLRPEAIQYAGGGSGIDLLDQSTARSKVQTSRYAVARATIEHAGAHFTVGTTHFPWTPDGSASDAQRQACDRLIASLGLRPLVLCGDFNAPRGGEIFSRLATHWHDNVPAHYVSSIDPLLHRGGPLVLMVDGLFSTEEYEIRDVEMHQGLSDHCAITAAITARK